MAGRRRRRVLRRRCAEESQIGVPVADSGRGLAREHARGTRKPLGHSGEGIGARDAVRGGDGGRTRRGIAGVSSRGLWGALQTKVASAKVRRGLGGAHRGPGSGERAA